MHVTWTCNQIVYLTVRECVLSCLFSFVSNVLCPHLSRRKAEIWADRRWMRLSKEKKDKNLSAIFLKMNKVKYSGVEQCISAFLRLYLLCTQTFFLFSQERKAWNIKPILVYNIFFMNLDILTTRTGICHLVVTETVVWWVGKNG